MKRKKVAVVLETEPYVGGSHQYALVVAECLKELSGVHFDLVALCKNRFWHKWCNENQIKHILIEWPNQSVEQVRKNIKFPLYSRLYNTYKTEIGKIIRKERIDILFLTTQTLFTTNINVNVIVPVHDLMHRYEPSFPEVKSEYQWREAVLESHAKYANFIITDSKLGRKQFIDSYLKNKKRKPTVLSLPFIVSGHISERKEEYIEVPNKYIFYPAQFWKHKNHINLIKAVQILKGDLADIHLVLVGSEKNCYDEITKYISDNGLNDNITILGFVSDGNITYLYRHAMGMIMPSYFGPTNIPPLEAMALGCPVAVSNKYAMPEQVGNAGLLFNPDSPKEIADCIRRLWTETELREKMTARGYQRINAWTQKDFKNRILKVIKRAAR